MAAQARRRRSNIKLEAPLRRRITSAANQRLEALSRPWTSLGVVTAFMEHMLVGESSADVSTMRVTVAARRPRACRRWER